MPSLPVSSADSTEKYKQIAQHTDTPYALIYTQAHPFELGYMAVERMCDYLSAPQCCMVYADHYKVTQGERKPHPVIDYQLGSVRDDFDFGSLLMFRTEQFKKQSTKLHLKIPTNILRYMPCVWPYPDTEN